MLEVGVELLVCVLPAKRLSDVAKRFRRLKNLLVLVELVIIVDDEKRRLSGLGFGSSYISSFCFCFFCFVLV